MLHSNKDLVVVVGINHDVSSHFLPQKYHGSGFMVQVCSHSPPPAMLHKVFYLQQPGQTLLRAGLPSAQYISGFKVQGSGLPSLLPPPTVLRQVLSRDQPQAPSQGLNHETLNM